MSSQKQMNNNPTSDNLSNNNNKNKQENYLSSIFIDEVELDQTEQKSQQPEADSKPSSIKSAFRFFGLYTLSFIALIILLFITPLFMLIMMFALFSWKNFSMGLLFFLCLSSVCYAIISFFFIQNENEISNQLLEDSISFIFSSFLVITYIETVINQYCKEQATVGNNVERILYSLTYSVRAANFYDVDYQQQELNYDSMKEQGYPNISRKFSLFSISDKPSNLEHGIEEFFDKFEEAINPNYNQFLILFSIICIKLLLVFYYISLNSKNITINEIIEASIIIFTYLYTTLNLNRILANNDLIRKSKLIQELKDYISFEGILNIKSGKKIDITSPMSLEAWDIARKYKLNFQKELLYDLELSYFCLIFYYVFVVLIVLSYFYELYWIIPKESPLLYPIPIIMSTFTFLFLTCFLLFRFKEGTNYNESFMELESSLNNLTDLIEDLQTMYDSFFNRKNDGQYCFEKEERNTVYGLIIKRIKLLSKYYIEQRIAYEGNIYDTKSKDILRKKMIKNIKQSLEKVKRSVQQDSLDHKYLFLNVLEINFNDFATTNLFGLVTVLPTIVPKFIEFYQNTKQE